MVVATVDDSSPRLRLLFVQHRQHAEDDGHASVQGHPHESLRDAVGDVLEVHGLAFDQNSDGDQRVKWARSRSRSAGRQLGQVTGRAAQQVPGTAGACRRRLDVRRRVESGVREDG